MSTDSLPKTYKAVSSPRPHGAWEVLTKELRDPLPHEVLVRVHASGVCSSDHFVHDGSWPGLQYPRIPGHEVIGRVAALGSALAGSTRLRVGALVGVGWNGGYCAACAACRTGDFAACERGDVTGFTFDGGHAEYMYAPERAVASLPEEVLTNASYAELAPLFCAGVTVFDAIRTSEWSPGDICLVQGIGGLGHLAIQYAAKLGLKVIAVSSGSSKAELALSLGAHAYLDASSTDVVAHILALGGARLILCTAPYAAHISAIIPAVARGGTVTLVSAATDGKIEVENVMMNLRRATVRGWGCGCAPDTERCVTFSTMANVKSLVQEYSLEEFARAYAGVMENKARFRNVIVFP
ncbi:GroES-like protein [Wolfiporia cocos MD-104 SS10]|uniref:GroES-like protein n=1 Tax=Wolfiporia cocos (strain MD-104) TaxID=742152 RepID=A0A2H3J9F6_WOLCO|nr:GroES-like protein [Wolfiporia cocos MD-104 SS10]